MKKWLCMLLVLLTCFGGALAQQAWQENWESIIAYEPRNAAYLAQKDGAWFVLDENGEVVHNYFIVGFDEFDEHGLTTVRINGKWGIMNRSGEFVVPPAYDYIGNFCCGRARFEDNEKRGFFDVTGAEVVPAKYYRANDFFGGYAAVAVKGERFDDYSSVEYVPLWGVIDVNGNVIVPCKYDDVEIDPEKNIAIARIYGETVVYELPPMAEPEGTILPDEGTIEQ